MPKKNEGSNGKKEKKDTKQAVGADEKFKKENTQLKKEVKELKAALSQYEQTEAEKLGVELADGEDIYTSPNGNKYVRSTQADGSKSLFAIGENGERKPV